MFLSVHYYILSLSSKTSRLYEGFRDELIDIQNTEFPCHALTNAAVQMYPQVVDQRLRDFFHKTDMHFAQYYNQDPLTLIVVGDSTHLSVFQSLTIHNEVIIGTVAGEYISTTPHDLGKIVWPVVMLALAGTQEKALRDLAEAEVSHNVVSGIEDVWKYVGDNPGVTLFVENDYHLKGSTPQSGRVPRAIDSINILEVFNDVVDIIIEKVLGSGGDVVFMNSGVLFRLQRIALIPRN